MNIPKELFVLVKESLVPIVDWFVLLSRWLGVNTRRWHDTPLCNPGFTVSYNAQFPILPDNLVSDLEIHLHNRIAWQ